MKKMLTVAAIAAFAGGASANLLVNPGFEEPVTSDGAPFFGFWEAFQGGGAASFNSTANPRSGLQNLEMTITQTDNTFAGAFQDVLVTAGQMYTWSGWHALGAGDFDLGIEFRIEWRDSVNNVEIGRTANSTDAPSGSAYEQWSLTAEAPVGADSARVVYAVQSFTNNDVFNTGIVYLDDVSFVPAPGAMALIGLGGLAAARRRR